MSGVDLDARKGEVHALLGENGAGKTTLMNIACGFLQPDAGTITVNGRQVKVGSPAQAFQHGLGMIHQNYRLAEPLTVAENVHFGWSKTPRFVSAAELEGHTAALSEQHGLSVAPGAHVRDLSMGERQRVAILRAVARGARTLVLDEPTAVLTPREAEHLFSIMRRMAAEGRSLIFISHKLREVLAVADRVSILRSGRRVATLQRDECDAPQLARLMVGREVIPEGYSRGKPGTPVLSAGGLVATDANGRLTLDDLSLSVRRGEILGVAGVSGNGQTALAGALTGLYPTVDGRILVNGSDLTGAKPIEFIKAGVGYISEDHGIGLAMHESVTVNAVMKEASVPPIRRGPLLSWSRIRAAARRVISAARLTNIPWTQRAATMSGGQMRRLLVHRELGASRSLLVAMHPTGGLDVAAARHVHQMLREARESGLGVLLISEDLDEIFVLSDRVAVIYEGRIVGEFERAQISRDHIGLLMGGHEIPGASSAVRAAE